MTRKGLSEEEKGLSEEDMLGLVRKIELDLGGGSTVEMAIRTAGISDATYSDSIRATEINPRR